MTENRRNETNAGGNGQLDDGGDVHPELSNVHAWPATDGPQLLTHNDVEFLKALGIAA